MNPGQMFILIPVIALLIPIVAIVMRGISEMLEKNRQFQIELVRQRQFGSSETDKSVIADLQQLKEEMARLRDTTTQYDLSIQHTLDDVQRRLSSLESRMPVVRSVSINPEPTPQPDVLINRT